MIIILGALKIVIILCLNDLGRQLTNYRKECKNEVGSEVRENLPSHSPGFASSHWNIESSSFVMLLGSCLSLCEYFFAFIVFLC